MNTMDIVYLATVAFSTIVMENKSPLLSEEASIAMNHPEYIPNQTV